MNQLLAKRALLLAGMIALTQLGTRAADSYLSPLPALPPEHDVADLPIEFDGWKGSDEPLSNAVLVNLGATAVVNRVYRNQRGEAVEAIVAEFTDYHLGIPHHPLDCYSRAGWDLQSTHDVRIERAGGDTPNIRVYILQKKDALAMIAFWAQLGDEVVFDNEGVRGFERRMRRQRLPLMKKVMLSTALDRPDRAEARLTSFAPDIFDAVDSLK